MHGARGVLESVVQAYPQTDVDIHVVRVPMLGSDNESAAREISGMFDDPRVHQYWDPKRRSGTSYSARVFPTYLRDIRKGLDATLPADHWWREMKRDWKAVKPEDAPLWDVAFLYDPGTKWDEHPPAPRDTVKQVFFYGPQSDGKSGMFFAGFKKPPLDTDWAVELAKAMTKLTGRKPKTPPKKETALSSGPSEGPGCEGGAVRAKLLVLEVRGLADGSTADDVTRALGAIKGVMRATADADSNLVQLLVDAGSSVTAERTVEFLGLAGYEAKEASAEQYDQVTSALASGGAVVIRNPADRQADEARDTEFPETTAGRLASAFIEAFNSGDDKVMRKFEEEHRAESALKSRPMSERLELYHSLFGDWGRVSVLQVAGHGDREITVTVRTEKDGQGLEMVFDLEEAASKKLNQIRIMPKSLDIDADERVGTNSDFSPSDSTSSVELTSLAKSLEPLRAHFNANKKKHRFVALLSPT